MRCFWFIRRCAGFAFDGHRHDTNGVGDADTLGQGVIPRGHSRQSIWMTVP